MQNILLISYGIIEYDGRLSELYKVAKQIGEVTMICCSNNVAEDSKIKVVKVKKRKYLSLGVYVSFVLKCITIAKEMKHLDVLFVDNIFASIPALFIFVFFKPKFIVQDSRELYFYKDIKSKAGQFFCRCESILMKKSDVIICANEQRSKIMFDHYKLRNYPLVFENIRFLSGIFNKEELDAKYFDQFKYEINIVSTGGLSVERRTDQIVAAMSKIPKSFGLYIVGDGTSKDKQIINDIISSNSLINVHIFNKVPMSELRYVLSKCDIGIVNYHKKDLNNMYCASGKVYEYLAEGLPIVTTENIPLKELCDKYRVGVADDSFFKGILEVVDNIKVFKENVSSYISGVSSEAYNNETAKRISIELQKIVENR